MRSIPKPEDREEWLEARHPYWNASDAATLLDRHPFKTLAEVITEKLDGPALDAPENTAMRRGRHLEHAIAAWWEEEHGLALYEPTIIYLRGMIAATLDRRTVGVEDRAIEIKTTSKLVAGPERYWIDQCQLQCYAADLVAVDLVALDASMQLQSWEVKRDDALIEQLVTKAEMIMAAVRRGHWPNEVSRRSRPKVAAGTSVEIDDETVDAARQLAEVRDGIRNLQTEEDRLRTLIVQRLGDASVGVHCGRNIVRYATNTRRGLDLTKLRADHPALVVNYETTNTYSTLRVLT